MITYLASPRNQLQADACIDMPVLVSYVTWSPWMTRCQQSWGSLLIDSGAYSEHTGNAMVDIEKYRDFVAEWGWRAEAVAGLDDISGNWRRSMRNYQQIESTFPTYHDTDPSELLDELVAMSKERGGWLGIGLKPPRQGKEDWLRQTMERIPDDIHVHGWALRLYRNKIAGFSSMDSTNWFRDAMLLRGTTALAHLTFGECLHIIVKRYKREKNVVPDKGESQLFLDIT